MKTHLFTFILAALPLAMTAQANEISMDASGMYAGSSSAAHTSSASSDCASARSLSAQDRDATDSNSNAGSASTGTAGPQMRVSDNAGEESGAVTATGSSAPGKSLVVPVKSRGTRWQSLVPGAIK